MNYLDALDVLHAQLRPKNYVEIGCREGLSLSRALCPCLAIDPDFKIKHGLPSPTRIFKLTSDAFFQSYDIQSLLEGPVDLAFIDGMHQAEYALRDFYNLEGCADEGSVIIIDDILPQDMSWASRERHTQAWTGDVYKIIPLLRDVRPELHIEVFDVEMKGMAVISNLSPDNMLLKECYPDYEQFLFSEYSELKSVEEIRSKLMPRPMAEFLPYIIEIGQQRKKAIPSLKSYDNQAYLDLLKRSLLNEIYLDDELRLLYLRDVSAGKESFEYSAYHDIRNTRRETYQALQASREVGQFPDRNIQRSGFSHTMMGRKRLDSLHHCLDIVRKNNVPGDLVECGVWRGGGCIFMAGYLKNYNDTSRRIIVADSFKGLPKPSHAEDKGIDLSEEKYPELAVSQETVKENFEVYGLLNNKIIFIEGWFKDTLKEAPTEDIAVLRLDGDLYESTMDILDALYDKVVPGGIIIVDDYGAIPACKKAVQDFFISRSQPLPIVTRIDWTGVYWVKEAKSSDASVAVRSFKTTFQPDFLSDYQDGVMDYTYRGRKCLKSPIDIAIYMKAIWDIKPATIIEIGTKEGGSALFMADIMESFDLKPNIVSLDISPPKNFSDDRIKCLEGDVRDIETIFMTQKLENMPRPWIVIEDSAHSFEGCMAALRFFSEHLQPGELLVIEDGVLDELNLVKDYEGGPNRAVKEFLNAHPDLFEIADDLCDMFGYNATFNPNGYLRKI